MAKKKKKEKVIYIDDGRTIADMSSVKTPYERYKEEDTRDEEERKLPPLSGENLRGFIGGTLLATILISLVYIVGIGLVILIMYLIFRAKLGI